LVDAITHDVQELQGREMPSVAVLCKTAAQSFRLHQQLQQRLGKPVHGSSSSGIRLITADDTRFQTGAVVLPAYLAKGLEFDAVILADVSKNAFGLERERGLLYTACTRALHELHMYYSGALSPLVAAVDNRLYEVASALAADRR
jgi:DNA helicase-2/ATP-dependent DNA helicase PcrA